MCVQFNGKEEHFLSGGKFYSNNDIKNVIAYFDKLCQAVAKLRKDEKLQMSWLQNDIDTIVTLLYSTKYKLTNLQ